MPLITKDLGLLALGSTVIGWGVLSLISLRETVSTRIAMDPSHYPQWSDLSTSVMWFAVFMVAHAISFLLLGPTARKLIPKQPYWSYEVWIAKLERFCSAVFQLGFSITATVMLYQTLRDSSWLPTELGGSGSTINCWKDGFPFQQVAPSLRQFYLIFIGYCAAEMVGHVIRERNRPDFYELLVHLAVTNLLLIFSYYGNFVRVGSLVMLGHSFSDIFVYVAKALVDTKITGGALSYIPLLVVYVWCRIYVHSSVILRSIWIEAPSVVAPAGMSNWHYINFLLSVLLMLHMYWMFVIVKIGLFLVSTGKSRDLQASLSSLNVRNQSAPAASGLPPSALMTPEGSVPDMAASSTASTSDGKKRNGGGSNTRRRQ